MSRLDEGRERAVATVTHGEGGGARQSPGTRRAQLSGTCLPVLIKALQ